MCFVCACTYQLYSICSKSTLLRPLKVPSPPEVSDEQLIEIVQSEDPMRFRVPMSLGEPHAEVDKGRSQCQQTLQLQWLAAVKTEVSESDSVFEWPCD